jgi:hypothetical protein
MEETLAGKSLRLLVYPPVAVLSALCFISQIVGAVYWAVTGHAWAAIASLFLPLFGAVTLIQALTAT